MEEQKKGVVRRIWSWMGRHKKTTTVIIGVIFVTWVAGDSQSNIQPIPTPAVVQNPTETSVQTVPTQSKEEAQKELDDIMTLAKKADLVTSYEFSDRASVVYIGPTWYTQNVQFKKDFLAKVGVLKKAITGYTHFEARDGYSNEKVGEITSFTQSIEVYK